MALLAFGTVWFWIILLFAWILITVAIEYGYQIRATFVVLAFFILYFFFGGKEVLSTILYDYIVNKPFFTLGWILSYFVLGTGWSIVKWALYVLRKREKAIEDIKRDSIKYHTAPTPVRSPQVLENKNLIIGWMIYWPFSALWTLINDPVKRAFTWIYYRISNRLQQISDRLFQVVNDEAEKIIRDRENKAEQRKRSRINYGEKNE